MDEATPANRPRKGLLPYLRRCRPRLRSQRGQAIVEYILVLIMALGFTRFVFFNKEFGFKAMVDKTMLRLGSFVEQNLKTGTKTGADGVKSLEAYGGTSRWSN
ncbi:MAG: hypothetical protein ACXWQO_00850 [Bdellovibrionota bacterium]